VKKNLEFGREENKAQISNYSVGKLAEINEATSMV
jgi:hypothetical protein